MICANYENSEKCSEYYHSEKYSYVNSGDNLSSKISTHCFIINQMESSRTKCICLVTIIIISTLLYNRRGSAFTFVTSSNPFSIVFNLTGVFQEFLVNPRRMPRRYLEYRFWCYFVCTFLPARP